MQGLFEYMLLVSGSVSIFILIVIVITPIFKKNYAVNWRYYVWILLAIRLLIPVDASISKMAVPMPQPSRLLQQVFNDKVAGKENTGEKDLSENINNVQVKEVQTQQAERNNSVNVNEKEAFRERIKKMHVITILQWIWMLGVLFVLIFRSAGYLWGRYNLMRWCSPVQNEEVLSIYKGLKKRLEIKKEIPLMICRKVTSPMIAGLIRPVLLLPKKTYSNEELEIILHHELVHYKRHDIWYKFILLLASTIHWFNPFVSLMLQEANKDIELICDDTVTKNMQRCERVKYNEVLLKTIEDYRESTMILSTNFNGGIEEMKERFVNILDMKKKKRGAVLTGIFTIVVASSVLFVACGKTALTFGSQAGSEGQKESLQAETSEAKAVLDKYCDLLMEATDIEQLYIFLDENIKQVSKEEADDMVNGILGFAEDIREVNYTKLKGYKDQYTDEMKNFVVLMEKEYLEPSIKDEQIQIDISELLERSVAFEEHIMKYSDGITYKRSYEMHVDLLAAAITGGYNEFTGAKNQYADESGSKVDGHAIDEYIAFANKKSGTKTADVLKEYINVLNQNQRNINDNVIEFYNSVYQVILTIYGIE